MSKKQWASVWIAGLAFVIGANILLAKRDSKMYQHLPQEQIANGTQ